VVQAFDEAGLAEMARQAGSVVELVPQTGDFLADADPLFRLYGNGAANLDERALRRSVALGAERTLKQDPAFGFRILVDIASKALSPAINDPTTGTLAVDQIEHLLGFLGSRSLGDGIVRDAAGEGRLVYRTPTWEDFVTLAVTEIRLYGATSPQVTRRLQALFEHLVRVLPEERSVAIRQEMALLHQTIDQTFSDPRDRTLALTSDQQGFGSRLRP
jgi:uncharacterized membrane protein